MTKRSWQSLPGTLSPQKLIITGPATVNTLNQTRLHQYKLAPLLMLIKMNGMLNKALSLMFQYIRAEVVDKQVVVSMTDLARKLESFIQSRGVDKLNESTKKHIRRKIEAEFGSALEIFPNDNGKLLIISKNLNRQETVKVNVALKKELEILKSKSTDVKQVIDQCSAYIRRAILDTKWKTPWPIHPCDLNGEPFPVPEYLSRLLMGLLTSDPDIINPSHRVMTLVGSFSQDIIYATTCGQTKPPKQLLISYGVKTLTGNVELIQMLNRFGHGVSYSQLEENDTALCLQKMASNLKPGHSSSRNYSA